MQISCNYRTTPDLRRAVREAPSATASAGSAPREVVPGQGPSGRERGAPRRGLGRTLHAAVGLLLSLNLLVLLLTGVVIQHREALQLEERTVSRRFLPRNYRPGDGPDGVRADIVVGDLHSGRMFGPTGALVLDLAAVGWFMVLGSGVVLYWLRSARNGNGTSSGNGLPFSKNKQSSEEEK